ncbi:MAG: adenylate/guanylate cyclase domain-containing protein [Thermoplasmatales archaeon]|nr:MAG: adenylate/guanylate cyclase domain-containing protein [Thermoplasmatales archaeon]
MPTILKNKLTKTLFISLFISAIVTMLMTAGFLDTWESKISDAFYAPGNTLDEIIIVAIDDESLQELGRWPWPRDHFARAINYLNQSSVIGIDISFFEPAEGDSELADSFKAVNVVLAMEYTSFSYKNGELYGESLLKPTTTLGTLGVDFETGFVNLYTDSDGVTRSFNPHISGIEDYDHISMVVVGEYLGITPDLGSSRMLINFFAPPGEYEYISFSDVYNNIIDPSYFKGKIVLIGATAADLHDDVITPISNQAMPGVEVNANLVQSILTRDFLYYQDDFSAIGVIFLFALLAGFLLFRFRIHIATVLLAVLAIAYIFFSIYTFDSGIIMNILYPLLSLTLVYITLVVIYYLTEERSRKWITSIFGKYVSPVVIDNLIKNPDWIKLGGEKRTITVFFSDIRGFTSISERLDPEELVHLLNEYLTEMTSIIIKDQGLVDKYMGDAIMAFWGAPLEQPNHTELACSSSLEMIDKLEELKKKWKKEGIPSFDIGIGLNSGDAIVGNMGSLKRFDYTAIGDNVNLASRMEGLNKIYGTNIIITENTHKVVKDKFETRKLDAVKVLGKKKPILIYELLSQKDRFSKKQGDFVRLYEAGLELYFKKNWKPAIKSFQDAVKLMEDNASHIFIARCQEFLKNPPSRDWDGVWEMETK